MLILNGYNNYYLYKFEYYCKKNNIIIFYISFYLFHLFQSFDIGYFNILKRSYNKKIKNFIRSYINYIIKPDFFAYFYIAFFIIFGEKNVRVSFRSISLVLFNLETVISKFDIKLYMSILTRSFSIEIDSWVFKTS